MCKEKVKVGDELYFVQSIRYPSPKTVKVTKVGRKWFEIDNGRWRADVNTWVVDGRGYHSPGTLYPNEEIYLAKKERQLLWGQLRRGIENKWKTDLSADQIRHVAAILGIELDPPP
jgi:hypothetical protein